MADDFTMAQDASGVTIRAKEIGSKLYQGVLVNIGGTADSPWDGVVQCTGYDTPDDAASQDPVSIAAVADADGSPTPVDADGDVVRILADRSGRVWVVPYGDTSVVGKAAADAAVGGNPLLIAGRASAATPTAVSADDDVAYFWLDRYGRLTIRTRPTGKTTVHAQVAYSASQTAATVYTPTSGYKLCVTHLVVSASAAGAVKLFDDSDSSGNAWSPNLSLAANGGWEAHFSDEHPLVMSAVDHVLKYTSGSGAAGSIWLHGWEEA
jgi:hypothetical protein